MTDQGEKTYDSDERRPDDDFWLAQGRKMVEESLPAVREAAKALMTGLGVLQGIYVAILGFGETAKSLTRASAVFAALPLVAWMVALLLCLRVMMTDPHRVSLLSPEDIRANYEHLLTTKQKYLQYALAGLAIGLLLAFLVIALAPRLPAE